MMHLAATQINNHAYGKGSKKCSEPLGTLYTLHMKLMLGAFVRIRWLIIGF